MENPLQRLQNTCRACMTKDGEMQCLFNSELGSLSISKMFAFLSTINISPDDSLPNTICSNCLNLLITTHDFQQMCLQSDLEMRAMLKNLTNNQQEESNPIPEIVMEFKSEDNTIKTNDQNPSVDGIKSEMAEYSIAGQQITENISERVKEEPNSDHDFDNVDNTRQILEDVSNDFCDEKIVRNTKILECQICRKIFYKKSLLNRHMSVHNTEGRPFECDTCKRRFRTEGNLKRHSSIHSCTLANMNHICKICSKSFSKSKLLINHMKTHQMESDKCHLCNKTFSSKSQFIYHMKKHNDVKQHVCHVCQKSFQQSTTLKDHLRTHSGEKPFLCAECGKAFNSNGTLRQHLLRHTGIKPFSCPECPSKFTFRGGLKAHMTTHIGIKPHTCDVCGSSFTKGYSLDKHKRIHTGEKRYACEVCGMRFMSSYHMKRHMRIHTGEKPYICTFCDRAFSQSNDLLKHTRVHIGEKTYKCSKCPEAFRLRKELHVHNQDHYKEEQMANE